MIRRFSLVVLAIPFLVANVNAQSKPAESLQLAAVQVTGAKRYTAAEVQMLSGLAPGTTVTPAYFDAATKLLASTGLFAEISYRYTTVAGKTTVTFAIQEPEWTMPVILDNFVWFKDDELVAALRQRIPSFDGTAPILEGVTELFTRELQALLKAKSIPGTVDFLPQGELGKGIVAFVFRVREPAPKVCALRFEGAAAIKESELTERLPIVGQEYSRAFIMDTSRGTLTNMYRQRGHWHVSLGTPVTVLEQGQACSGVTVTVPVQEGAAYATERIAWTGNNVMQARDLDALMPLKAGNVANISDLEEGLRRVRTAYGKQGYVMHQAVFSPRLDDERKQVTFDVKIDEGPQFRFGTLTFPGLPPDAAQTLSKRWRLKTGDVFDASYPSRFFMEEIRPRLRQGVAPPAYQTQIDEPNRVMNVKFVFGG